MGASATTLGTEVALQMGMASRVRSLKLFLVRRETIARQVILDPARSARIAKLRHASDSRPGIRRVRCGAGFRYVGPSGEPVRDLETLSRIRGLVIPPAWTDVWICPFANGHLQATGRDSKGRKQFRYHNRWREVRDEGKFARMISFGLALPRIRRRIRHDLALPGLPQSKVLAAIVRLLERTLVRVGNEEYARMNGSYGLTTLRDRHLRLDGSSFRLVFHGKNGTKHVVAINDPRLARLVKRCRDLPGKELFQYVDREGNVHDITSAEVNEYLREISGQRFTAKDFRTWAGTVRTAWALHECGLFQKKTEAKRNIVRAISAVALQLRNTPAICRKCYVHHSVLDAYLEGTLLSTLQQWTEKHAQGDCAGLRLKEAAVLTFLQRRLALQRSSLAHRKQVTNDK
jgi:DNA topoisomerase I